MVEDEKEGEAEDEGDKKEGEDAAAEAGANELVIFKKNESTPLIRRVTFKVLTHTRGNVKSNIFISVPFCPLLPPSAPICPPLPTSFLPLQSSFSFRFVSSHSNP